MTARGGRPRDPLLDQRIVDAVTALIAANGTTGLTGEAVAGHARVGKASIYRRWHSFDDLLAAAVEDLGVRFEDLQLDDDLALVGLREDLWCLFAAAGSGPRAVAEVAVLPLIGRDERLVEAHARGPLLRLYRACAHLEQREKVRGQRLPSQAPDVMAAGVAWLQQRMAVTGRQVQPAWIEDCLDYVVLPALGRERVAS